MSAPNPYFLKLTETETLRFLDLYQKEEILWNSNLDLYRNRQARLAAAERVAKVLNVRGFSAEYVLIKFKNLRSSYCQELKKVAESITSGAEEIYRPKVFWFHKMNGFLRPYVQSRAAQSNFCIESSDTSDGQGQEICTSHFLDPIYDMTATSINVDEQPQFLPGAWASYDESSTGRLSETQIYADPEPSPLYYATTKRRRRSCDIDATATAAATTTATKTNNYNNYVVTEVSGNRNSSETNGDDSFDCFGKYIASLLRGMPKTKAYEIQLEIVTKVINAQIHNGVEERDETDTSSSRECEANGFGAVRELGDMSIDIVKNEIDEKTDDDCVDLTD